MLHDAIGQAGATVNRIDIEVAPQHHDSTGSDPRDSSSGGQQQDGGHASSQDRPDDGGTGSQKQNQSWRQASALDELDIEI
jgi:hypothetical protein